MTVDAAGPRATLMDGGISVTGAVRPMTPRTARALADVLRRMADMAERPDLGGGRRRVASVFVLVPRRGLGGMGDGG